MTSAGTFKTFDGYLRSKNGEEERSWAEGRLRRGVNFVAGTQGKRVIFGP